MISNRYIKQICSEDPSLIENYDKAVADTENTWHCHHRLEIQEDKILSKNDLIEQGLYYHRPAKELIFMTHSDHTRLHFSNISDITRKKLSLNAKNISSQKRQKISNTIRTRNLGSKHSNTTKSKISESLKIYWKKVHGGITNL